MFMNTVNHKIYINLIGKVRLVLLESRLQRPHVTMVFFFYRSSVTSGNEREPGVAAAAAATFVVPTAAAVTAPAETASTRQATLASPT